MSFDQALIWIFVLLLIGVANCFYGWEMFRPIMLIVGFIIGVVSIKLLACATCNQASDLAIIVSGISFALAGFLIYEAGIFILGMGIGSYSLLMFACMFRLTPISVWLFFTLALVCGSFAVIFHHYFIIFATSVFGALLVTQAIYLFFPDTIADFDLLSGFQYGYLSTNAMVLGAIVTVVLTLIGGYMQYTSYMETECRAY